MVRCPIHLLSLIDWNAGDFGNRTRLINSGDIDENEKQHQREQLQEVREFCDNQMECRRQQILRQFGEQFNPQHCRKRCDVCLRDEVMVQQDFSDAAVNLLRIVSGLTRDGDTLSKTMLVDVFRGSQKKEVISRGLQNNPLFGVGKCYNKDLVTRIIDQLVKQEGLEWSYVRKEVWSSKYIIVSFWAIQGFVWTVTANITTAWIKRDGFQRAQVFVGIASKGHGGLHPPEGRTIYQLKAQGNYQETRSPEYFCTRL